MKLYIVSLINAVILTLFGLWGYLSSDTPSATALIPVIIGAILLVLNFAIKKGNKVSIYVGGVLTLLILGGLVMPFKGAIAREDTMALARVIIMQVTTLLALLFFIKKLIKK